MRNRTVCRRPEEVHTDAKQDHIKDAWYQYPFPQTVFIDELVRF
jgi:hypothetical protein